MKLYTKISDKRWAEWSADDMRNSCLTFGAVLRMIGFIIVAGVVIYVGFCLLMLIGIGILSLL